MPEADILALTGKELDRMKLIVRWKKGVLTQEQAAVVNRIILWNDDKKTKKKPTN